MKVIGNQSERQNDSLLEFIYGAVWFHQLKWWLKAAGRRDCDPHPWPCNWALSNAVRAWNFRPCCQDSEPGENILYVWFLLFSPKYLAADFWVTHSCSGSCLWNCQAKCPWSGSGITFLFGIVTKP